MKIEVYDNKSCSGVVNLTSSLPFPYFATHQVFANFKLLTSLFFEGVRKGIDMEINEKHGIKRILCTTKTYEKGKIVHTNHPHFPKAFECHKVKIN